MKKIFFYTFLMASILLSSCVDEYTEANGPVALDGPFGVLLAGSPSGAVAYLAKDTEEDEHLYLGINTDVTFVYNMVDVPGLIDSSGVTLSNKIQANPLALDVIQNIEGSIGKTTGEVSATYKAGSVTGNEDFFFTVYDAQNPKKLYAFDTYTIRIVDADCFPTNTDLIGDYNSVTTGTNASGGGMSYSLEYESALYIRAGTVNNPGYLRINDGSFGLYESNGADNGNFINIEICGTEILSASEDDGTTTFTSFTGTITDAGIISIDWEDENGNTGQTVMTPTPPTA